MHKQENHQVRDSEAVQRGGEEDADVHLVLNGGRGEGIGGHERGPRAFTLKFYTEEDNWDMTGNNTPHSRSTKKSIQRGMRNCFRRCARANLLEPVTKVPRINPR